MAFCILRWRNTLPLNHRGSAVKVVGRHTLSGTLHVEVSHEAIGCRCVKDGKSIPQDVRLLKSLRITRETRVCCNLPLWRCNALMLNDTLQSNLQDLPAMSHGIVEECVNVCVGGIKALAVEAVPFENH